MVLTRRVDEGIVIQGNILITVLRVDGDRVRIGISAPQEITVLRQELLNQKGNGEAVTAGEEPPSQDAASSNSAGAKGYH